VGGLRSGLGGRCRRHSLGTDGAVRPTVYHPPAFFWWWFAYDAYARDIFVEGAYIAAAGGIAAVVVAVTISVWRAREAKRFATYGSAR
jgi:type IV secretion system protein VirD4